MVNHMILTNFTHSCPLSLFFFFFSFFGVGSVCARRMVGNLAVPSFLFWVENGPAAALCRTDWDKKAAFVTVRMQKVEVGSSLLEMVRKAVVFL